MKRTLKVEVEVEPADGGKPGYTIREAEDAAVEALREALNHAMNRGFNHPLADCAVVSVQKVSLYRVKA